MQCTDKVRGTCGSTVGPSLKALVGVLLVALGAAGCVTGGGSGSFFDAAEKDMRRATNRVRKHLVHATLAKRQNVRANLQQGYRVRSNTQMLHLTGIAVSEEGHVLLAQKLDDASMEDLRVWVGRDETQSEFVAYDKQLNMSIIRIDSEAPLVPLALAPYDEYKVGQWCATLSTGGEDAEFRPNRGLVMITAQRPTRHSEVAIDGIGSVLAGTPLLDRQGVPVAIAESTHTAIALSSAAVSDIDRFVRESVSGARSDEEDDKARLGACLSPINRDHAKLLGIGENGLWVVHVLAESSAAEAGLEVGDLVVALDGAPLRFSGMRVHQDFFWRLSPKEGKAFAITVLRDGEDVVCEGTFSEPPEPATFESKDLGLVVRDIDDSLFVHQHLAVREGVWVSRVLGGSAASTSSRFGRSLIEKGDVIVAINGTPTPDTRALTEVAERIREDELDAVLVEYRRGRMSGYAALNLGIGDNGNGDTE